MKRLAALCLLAGTLACSITTTGQKFQSAPEPPQGQALVYLMRTQVSSGGIWEARFTVDGKKVVSLYDKGYSWVHLPSGECKFDVELMPGFHLDVDLDLVPGKTYYLQFTEENLGMGRFRTVLRPMDAALAQQVIADHQYKPAAF